MPASEDSNIEFEFVDYNLSSDSPHTTIKMTNNSTGIIFNAGCNAVGSKDGIVVDTALVFPGSLAYLRPGDFAVDVGVWWDQTTLSELDAIAVSCDWLDYTDRNTDPLVAFDLIEYSTDEAGKPVVVAQLTNNSANTIYSATCDFVARKNNQILTYAVLTFNDLNDVATGESFEDSSPFTDSVGGFDGFNSNGFDRGDLYCTYVAR